MANSMRYVGSLVLRRPRPGWTRSLRPSCSPTSSGPRNDQASMGDLAWKALVERHHAVVREELARWRGEENDTAGDSFYATFDGPGSRDPLRVEIIEQVRALEIEVRAGAHIGACELIDGKIGGITVTIGARVAAAAGPRRCSSRRPSRTWSPVRVWSSTIAVNTSSRAFLTVGVCTRLRADRILTCRSIASLKRVRKVVRAGGFSVIDTTRLRLLFARETRRPQGSGTSAP